MIDVTLIGTAALFPLPDRALASAAVTCNGRTILLDCGEGTQSAARAANVNLMDIGIIALTHYHGDHIFGLPGLLQTLFSLGREEKLVIIGPGDVEQALSPVIQLAGTLSYPLVFEHMPENGVFLHEIDAHFPETAILSTFPTVHRVESQGYTFSLLRPPKFLPDKAKQLGIPVSFWKDLQFGNTIYAGDREITPDLVRGPARKGLKVVFSGDTGFCEPLLSAAAGADLLICEATYAEDEHAGLAEERGHMNFDQAGRLAAEASVRRLWLCHYSPRIKNPEEWLENARRHYPETVAGQDGMHITLQFDNS